MPGIYSKLVLKEIPRLISLMDRDPYSPTYGCFDRAYWKYKTKDFANARMQEACYTLALLYRNNFEKGYFRNEEIREYAEASMRFWSRMQDRDGSFSEYMPSEKSHVATAFSAYCVASAYLLLGTDGKDIVRSLRKAGMWLGRNDDLIVVNHDAGAASTLYLIYKITGEKRFLGYCRSKIRKVMENQDEEGWFREYGGADVGYQSFSVYYLARYYILSGDRRVLRPLERAVEFFSHFIHPDLSMGGFYGSRETSFVIPAGFHMLTGTIRMSGSIAEAIKKSLSLKKAIGPYSFDDRFVADGLYPYLESEIHVKRGRFPRLPKDRGPFVKYFRKAGLYVRKTDNHYMIIGTKNGGKARIFGKGKEMFSHNGWISKKGGGIISTCGPSDCKTGKNEILIKGRFYHADSGRLDTKSMIILRFMLSLGLNRIIKRMMRKRMIINKRDAGISFGRRIRFLKDSIEILDSFRPAPGNITSDAAFSDIYSTSTGLFGKGGHERIIINRPVKGLLMKIGRKGAEIKQTD